MSGSSFVLYSLSFRCGFYFLGNDGRAKGEARIIKVVVVLFLFDEVGGKELLDSCFSAYAKRAKKDNKEKFWGGWTGRFAAGRGRTVCWCG